MNSGAGRSLEAANIDAIGGRPMLKAALTAVLSFLLAGSALAAGGDPIEVPTPVPSGTPGLAAEARYNAGWASAQEQDWPGAEAAYREAIDLRPDFADAWNGLGHALKQQKRFEESIRAYNEALRLRPDFPLALEYLGETYVEMGRLEDARSILERLRPLDPGHADELARTIFVGSASW
jgi:tetratricopeptide (TPR) repeat protein